MIAPQGAKWFLELDAGKDASLPYKKILATRITAQFESMPYEVDLSKGKIDSRNTIRLNPDHNQLLLDLDANSRH